MLITLIILTILTINLALVFIVKSRIGCIISILTSNLVFITLFHLIPDKIIDQNLTVKGFVTASIIYSIIILLLLIKQKERPLIFREIHRFKIRDYIIASLLVALSAISIYSFHKIETRIVTNSNIYQTEISKETRQVTTNQRKTEYLYNNNQKEDFLFNQFTEFLIIISMIITILFLSIKNQDQ